MPRPSSVDEREAERRRVGLRAQLRVLGSSRLDVDILDLSETGFRVESIYGLPENATVFLTIPTFTPMRASVAWRKATGYGCRFYQPLHPAVFDMIVARHPG